MPTRRLCFGLSTLLLVACGGGVGQEEDNGTLVIQGATIFTSPGVPPIENGTIVVIDGVIESVGSRDQVRIPPNALLLDGTNHSLLAGFWNSHVQIDDEILAAAAGAPAEELQALLWERFTRFGYSTIVETSLSREELAALVSRFDSGEVMGPRILVVGGLDVPGVYFPDPMAFPWTGEFLSGLIGGDIALVSGIELQRRAATLLHNGDLDAVSNSMDAALSELRPFEDRGGRILFGTGSGYIDQYDPISEHLLLEDAGVSFATRLAALTSEPAIRFGLDFLGAVEPGMVADLVLVDGDPEADITSLARIRLVLREGRTIFW
jgi:cytosine/adenosine deaminase-related metal-dependent hydrolase